MKVELDKIRLNYSPLTDNVYAGVVKDNIMQQKVDVTNDFLHCIILRWKNQTETIISPDGSKYEISINEIKTTPPL